MSDQDTTKHIIISDGRQVLWTGQAPDTNAAHKLGCAVALDFYDPDLCDRSTILAKLHSKNPDDELIVTYRHPMMDLTVTIRSERAMAEAMTFAELTQDLKP